jgi:hypothetical protein
MCPQTKAPHHQPYGLLQPLPIPKNPWYSISMEFILYTYRGQNMVGWKSFKVYHIGQKGPNPYCSPFLPYILIPMKNNELKFVKKFKNIIFGLLQF